MVRPKQEEIDKELKRLELDTDGSGAASGSATVPGEDDTADTEEMVKEAFGNEPDDKDGFNSGLEVNKDEKDILMGEDHEDADNEELDSENTEEERDAEKDQAESTDPYDTLGEDDDTTEEAE